MAPTAKAVFFGASYHVDYATLLARPADLPAVAEAVAAALATPGRRPRPRPPRALGRRRPPPPPLRRPGGRRAGRTRSAPGPARAGRWSASARRSARSSPSSRGWTSTPTSGRSTRRSATRCAASSAGRRPPATSAWSARPTRSATWTQFVDLHQKRWGAEGLFPPTAGGDQSRTFFRRLFELLGDDGTIQLHFLAVGGRRIAAGVWFEDGDAWYLYNAGVDPEARELSPGVLMSAKAIEGAIARRPARASTTSAATSPTSTSGARSTSRSSASSSCEQGRRDGCPAARRSLRQADEPAPGPRRTRPCASWSCWRPGTNGGAQEHVYSLLSRMDRGRYEPTVISLSHGSAERKIARLGIPVHVIDEPDDAIAVGAVATLLADIRPEVIHNHMYRAELVGTRAALALADAGLPRPYVVGTVHSSRVRSPEDREVLRAPDAAHGPPHRGERGRSSTRSPTSAPATSPSRSSTTAWTWCATTTPTRAARSATSTACSDEAQIVGVVARLEHEKGHPTLLDAWPAVLRRVPEARLLVVGEGSRRAPLEAQAAALGIAERVVFTGRRDDVPAVTAALDVAVLPSYREAQGLTILEAMALSRPGGGVGGRRHPRDDRGRPDGTPGAAARPATRSRRRSSASSPTTPTPTCWQRAATTWSTSASAWS